MELNYREVLRSASDEACREAWGDFSEAAQELARFMYATLTGLDIASESSQASRAARLLTLVYVSQFVAEAIERTDAVGRRSAQEGGVPEDQLQQIDQEIQFSRSEFAAKMREEAKKHLDILQSHPLPAEFDGATGI